MKIKKFEQYGGYYCMLENKRNHEIIEFKIDFEKADKNGIKSIMVEFKIDECEILEINPVRYEVHGSDEYDNDGEVLLEIHSIDYVSIKEYNYDEHKEIKSGLKMKYFESVKQEIIDHLNQSLC